MAVLMAIGASFAVMNTMYASVARRSREIGVLRVLGFQPGSILLSFLGESVLLALARRSGRAVSWPCRSTA